jgi:hypothetical protein
MIPNSSITSISVQYWLNRLSHCLQQVATARLTKPVALSLRAKAEAVRKDGERRRSRSPVDRR